MSQSGRQYPRYAIEAEIELVTAAGSTRGRTKNVSLGGLAAYVDRPVPPGLRVNVRMSLVFDEDTFSEPLEVPARIVWCTPVADKFQLGTSFMPMSSEQVSYLGMFLRYLEEGLSIQAELAEDDETGNFSDPFQ
jgi:hypothetical protein